MRADGRAVVVAAAITLVAGCEAVYGPTAPSRDWAIVDSAHYALYVRPGSFAEANAQALLNLFEDQLIHASAALGLGDSPRISAFLYNAGADINPPLPQARAGVAFPETNALHAVAFAPLDDDLRAMLAHEANHVIVQNGLGRAGTSFMNEGLASALVSPRLGNVGAATDHRWVRNNRARVPRLADLADDSKWSSNSNEGYRASSSFVAYLLERYGAQALRQLYYARSEDLPRRVQEIYGKSLDALEAEWLAAV